MQPLTLTLIQTATHWHDPAANRAHFGDRLRALEAPGHLVVLPEMFSTGFTMASAEQAETMDGPTVAWLREIAAEIGAAVCGSVVIRDGDEHFNRFLCATADGELVAYDKRHLFRMAGEHEHYSPGRRRVVFELAGWRICPQVCYDLRFPAFVRHRGGDSDEGYDLLLYVANWPARRAAQWRTLLAARAIENQCYLAAVNVIGRDGAGVDYSGDSGVWNMLGEQLLDAGDQDVALTTTLDANALADWRRSFPAWMDADEFEIRP